VLPLKFLTCAQRFEIGHAVERKNSVKVVNFVLKKLRKVSFFISHEFVRYTIEILITHANPTVPFDL